MTDHIIKSRLDGNTYDLTKITTSFGLLPEDVQEAIGAWEHGVECYSGDRSSWWPVHRKDPACYPRWTYRCRPAPTVTKQVIWLGKGSGGTRLPSDTHRITIRYTGDTLPCGEYTGPDGAVFIVEEAK